MAERHDPVLLEEAVRLLAVRPGDTVVDGTVGGAGHFAALMGKLGQGGTLIGFDADPAAIERGTEVAKRAPRGVKALLVNRNFRELDSVLDEQGIETVDRILLDLGWSSFHLDSSRGFSFKGSEPLLMTYGTDPEATTAAELVNTSPEETLADIFFTYGEERFARPIARSIVRARKITPILTTDQLVDAIMAGTPAWYHHRRLHPATKVFQALRIAVNDELGALREVLEAAMRRLTCGGRIAVITFHSIEDRIVKNALRDAAHAGLGQLTTKKPVTPGMAESMRNPRARSAKLRVYEQCREEEQSLTAFSTFAYA
jgi:16S rRNA (cytosine1402-N4)-methyltransferase